MRKFITWVLIILGALFLLGSCDGCDGCDDCSGGCDLTSGCESCVDLDACEKQYKGEITMNIHKHDGTVLTIKGNRERGKKNCIINNSGEYETFGSYTVPKRAGYTYDGLEYYGPNGYVDLYYGDKYINYNALWKIKDGSEIDVYENWDAKVYYVAYRSSNDFGALQRFNYAVGSEILLGSDISNVFNYDANDRKTLIGYTAYYKDRSGQEQTFEWTFGGKFNENHVALFEDNSGTINSEIIVRANWLADTVKVELNFNVTDGVDVGNVVKTLTVGYDEDLSKYFGEYVNVPNRQFFGWYLDEDLTAKAPKEISAAYKDTPLKLYAKHLEFKEIYIDLQDGKGAQPARAYEDGTFLIKNNSGVYAIEIPGTKDDKQFYGLSLDPQDERRTLYGAIIASGTYYATYI